MHLRSIKLRGFKSFPDPVEVTLEPGVAVVVGPNGSGKSNVSDAIVWAAGSLTPSEMRAEKPDDVLFAGGGDRVGRRALRGRARLRQRGRRLRRGARLQRDLDPAPPRPRRRGPVPRQPRARAAHRPRRAARRRRARRIDALDRLAGQGRRGPRVEARGQAGARRGGCRSREVQASPAPRRAEARTGRDAGRARARRRGRGAQAAPSAGAAGDRRGACREARGRDRRAACADRADRPRGARRAAHRGRGAAERRRARPSLDAGPALVRPRRPRACGGRAVRRGRGARGGASAPSTGSRARGSGSPFARSRRPRSPRGCATTSTEAERAQGARTDETLRALEHAAREAAGRGARRVRGERPGRPSARGTPMRCVAAVERSAAVEAEARLEAIRLEREGVDRAPRRAHGRLRRREPRARGPRRGTRAPRGASRERDDARSSPRRRACRRACTRARGAPSPAELEHHANEARAAARAASTERDDLAERARSARDRLAALERSLGEREGVAPAARALAAEGERLVVSELEVEPGHEKAVAAALAWRASALLATDARHALALLERARDGGLGRLDVLLDRDAPAAAEPPVPGAQPLRSLASGADDVLKLLDGIWLVDADRLLDVSAGTAITIDGYGYDADARRALVRRRDGRGRSPRARCASPGADGRGGRAGRPRRGRRPRGR